MVSLWGHYLAKVPGPNFNNGPGNNSNSGRIVAHKRLFQFNSNNGPSRRDSILGMLKITTACTIAALLISLFSHQNTLRRALRELKLLKKLF